VVAEEVRNLAQRAAEAARDTTALIEESQESAENGTRVSDEVEAVLNTIVEVVQKVTQFISMVSTASNEQAQGINQVNVAVAQVDRITQGNTGTAQQAASASEALSDQAGELNRMVNTLVEIVGGISTDVKDPVVTEENAA